MSCCTVCQAPTIYGGKLCRPCWGIVTEFSPERLERRARALYRSDDGPGSQWRNMRADILTDAARWLRSFHDGYRTPEPHERT